MSDAIFDLFDEIQGLDGLDVDILGGPNVRLKAGAESTFAIENRTGFITIPKNGMSLMRVSITDQNGMIVLRTSIGVKGEKVGLVGDGDERILLPCYGKPAFTSWGGWVHLLNCEFMNPDEAAVEALKEIIAAANFVEYVPRQTNADPYVRAEGTSTVLDREAPGGGNNNITDRFEAGVRLDTAVIVPDVRVEANVTEYVSKAEATKGQTIRRPAFTSFIDTLVPNMKTVLTAAATGTPQDKREAFNRLSTLTGHNPESGWPLRPTLGYLTPVGGEEISLFGDRGASTSESTPAATPVAATPQVEVTSVSEAPFDE